METPRAGNEPESSRKTAAAPLAVNEGHFTAEEIEQALRNRDSSGARYTMLQVLDYLHSLESGQ